MDIILSSLKIKYFLNRLIRRGRTILFWCLVLYMLWQKDVLLSTKIEISMFAVFGMGLYMLRKR